MSDKLPHKPHKKGKGTCLECRRPRPTKLKEKAHNELLEALEEEFERYCDCLNIEPDDQ